MRSVFQHYRSWRDLFRTFLHRHPIPANLPCCRDYLFSESKPHSDHADRLSWVSVNSNWHVTSSNLNLKQTLTTKKTTTSKFCTPNLWQMHFFLEGVFQLFFFIADSKLLISLNVLVTNRFTEKNVYLILFLPFLLALSQSFGWKQIKNIYTVSLFLSEVTKPAVEFFLSEVFLFSYHLL